MNRANWVSHQTKLHEFVNMFKETSLTRIRLLTCLEEIFGDASSVDGVNTRVIALVEFCFAMAEGPYSPFFKDYIAFLKKIFTLYPPIVCLLNKTGRAALANIVLGGTGRLKFQITDQYELVRVLEAWQEMGLKPQSAHSVFLALFKKRWVVQQLKKPNYFLMARLRQIFPHKSHPLLSEIKDINQQLYKIHKKRFASTVLYYNQQGLSLQDMINIENTRLLPVGIKRNNLLAYLVKLKHDFQCQICGKLKTAHASNDVEAHHIIPLSQGGPDESHNILIICPFHHKEAHARRLQIEMTNVLQIQYKCDKFYLKYN